MSTRQSTSRLRITVLVLLTTIPFFCSCSNKKGRNSDLQNGDLIFQTSQTDQSRAIQLATKSRYSHCGVIFFEKGRPFVFEAIQPVKATPLDEWIARGKNGHYVIKRLANAEEILTPQVLAKMKSVGRTFMGKNYDLAFEWSDRRIYCSELIWKIYERAAGVELGTLQKLKDFDLSHPVVRKKIKERYGTKIPYEETVISPSSLFDCRRLVTVVEN